MPNLGELERAIMEELWAASGPQSVRDVHAELSRDRELAYTTVMTVLDRLAKKGVARREREGRAWVYWPVQSREAMVADIMAGALADRDVDRSAALVAFVDRVGPDEAALLLDALRDVESRSERTDPPGRTGR